MRCGVWCGVVCRIVSERRPGAGRWLRAHHHHHHQSQPAEQVTVFFSLFVISCRHLGQDWENWAANTSLLIRRIFISGETSTLTGSCFYQLQLCSNKINLNFLYQSSLKSIYVQNIYIFVLKLRKSYLSACNQRLLNILSRAQISAFSDPPVQFTSVNSRNFNFKQDNRPARYLWKI